MIANTLPLITWRWLKVNDSIIELPEVKDQVHNIVAEEGDNISTCLLYTSDAADDTPV